MEFKEFAQRPDAYAKLCSMIGPSIYGHSDVKKAIACLLFGGSKKACILIKPLICVQ
jgi:DNA replication licensing factor MCM5